MNTQCIEPIKPVVLHQSETRTFTFHEITDPLKIEEFFLLRYQVYNESDLAPFLKQNVHQIDMDVYDLHSRFFGIYCNSELIAGVRTVIHKEDYFNPKVYEIGKWYGIYTEDQSSREKLLQLNYPDFPFLSYPEVPNEIKQFYENQRKDKKVFMVSRCVIHPAHRGLKTMQMLTEGIATALCLMIKRNLGLVVTDVCVPHSKFYGRYGFNSMQNASTYIVHGNKGICLAMLVSTNLIKTSFPQYLHSKFEQLILEYSLTHKITRTL